VPPKPVEEKEWQGGASAGKARGRSKVERLQQLDQQQRAARRDGIAPPAEGSVPGGPTVCVLV
jgi:hypothetical protein